MRARSSVPVGLLLAACSGSHAPDGSADGGGADGGEAIDARGIDADGGGADGSGEIDASGIDADGSPCPGSPPLCAVLAPRDAPVSGCCGDHVSWSSYCDHDTWRCPAGFTELDDCRGYWTDDMCASLRPPVCDAPSSCVLLPESCCGICGAATPADMIAVHVDRAMENRAITCADPIACPECFMETDPYLVATCEGGACVARDLHVEELTACATDADCTLAPRRCCDCGDLGPFEAVAFNPSRGSFAALVCDPGADCPPCALAFSMIRVACDAGHCAVRPR
jgi:hypothetical protein